MKRGIYLGLVALLVGGLSACSSTDREAVETPTASATPTASTTDLTLGVTCKPTTAIGHEPKTISQPSSTTPGRKGTFTLVTNCGDIVIATDGVKAPITITNLTALATGGYFDNSLCHRLTTQGIFVLQCGDPTASGMGGPGFAYEDENLPQQVENNYPAGTVAMANSGPATNGSQFFLVYADTTLGASYTIWGNITSGLDIVKAIAAAGVEGGGADGAPAVKVAIEKVIVK